MDFRTSKKHESLSGDRFVCFLTALAQVMFIGKPSSVWRISRKSVSDFLVSEDRYSDGPSFLVVKPLNLRQTFLIFVKSIIYFGTITPPKFDDKSRSFFTDNKQRKKQGWENLLLHFIVAKIVSSKTEHTTTMKITFGFRTFKQAQKTKQKKHKKKQSKKSARSAKTKLNNDKKNSFLFLWLPCEKVGSECWFK